MKKIFFVILIVFLLDFLYANENIVNRIFFDDFKVLGNYFVAEPVMSLGLFSGAIGITSVIMNNDNFIKEKVMENKSNFLDNFFNTINYAGDGICVLAANSFLFLFSDKEKETAENLIECLAFNGIINYSLKTILGRERPSSTDNPYIFNFFSFNDNSLPSGHTLVAFTWAEVLNDAYGIWYISYPAAALVGYARIYKNSHWASDVFAGAFLGVFLTKTVLAKNKNPNMVISYDKNLMKCEFKYEF